MTRESARCADMPSRAAERSALRPYFVVEVARNTRGAETNACQVSCDSRRHRPPAPFALSCLFLTDSRRTHAEVTSTAVCAIQQHKTTRVRFVSIHHVASCRSELARVTKTDSSHRIVPSYTPTAAARLRTNTHTSISVVRVSSWR
jgi:hypothetical protein